MNSGACLINHQRAKTTLATCLGTTLLAFGMAAGTTLPQKTDKALPQQTTTAHADDDAKRLILLMDTNKDGKVSKQEFMSFMSSEFDRLDKDKNGELTADELRQYQMGGTPRAVGK